MSLIEQCDFEEPFAAPYIEIALSVIIFMILQILLFTNTVYYEYQSYKKHKKVKQTKCSIRITYISLQCAGFYFTSIDLFRFVLDPYFKFIQQDSGSCSLVAYSPKVITIIYFAIYLVQVLLRLEVSFRGSHIAISRVTFISLAVFILIPSITVPISFFLLVEKPCIWEWVPSDINAPHDFVFCDFHSEGMANTVIGLGIIWIVIANIIYGIIFGVKLNQVLRFNTNVKNSFKLKSLIIKNTILTSVGSISTLINWFMWLSVSAFTGIGISFLYFDLWFNCFTLALMFQYNEYIYKKLCKVCIVCCLRDCDKTYNRLDQIENKRHLNKLKRYLHATQHSEIFTSRGDHDLSTTNFSSENTSHNKNENETLPTAPLSPMTPPMSAGTPPPPENGNMEDQKAMNFHIDLNATGNDTNVEMNQLTPLGSVSDAEHQDSFDNDNHT